MLVNSFVMWCNNYPMYNIVLIVFFISLLIGVVFQTIGYLIAPNFINLDKQSAYECGFEPYGDARSTFEISYYKTSILFLLFDLELVFLTPGCVVLINWMQLYVFYFFIFLLLLGFLYEWSINALDWVK
jgi:NADH:ubiquinone oxidoreductase subunit 3 (subunit A)